MPRDERPSAGVQSVEIAGRVLAALADSTLRGMKLREVAAASGLPPSKAHRYLASLIRAGLVRQNAETGHYDLGDLSLRLGLAALGKIDLVRFASDLLPALRDEVGETIMLSVMGNHGPTVIRLEESGHPIVLNARVGFVFPLLSTATGRAFAAYMPQGAAREAIIRHLGKDDPKPVSGWLDRLAAIRNEGAARDEGSYFPGINALAAPVFDHQGKVAAVLTVLGRHPETDISAGGRIAGALRSASAALSRRLGGP